MLLPVSDQLHQGSPASGTVVRLWRYPVKSMLGEQRAYLDFNDRGVVGDRLFAIRTVEGTFGSGKSTRRFRHIAGLFGFQATYQDDIPEITFPDGQIMRADDPFIHTHLSNTLGQPVTLAIEGAVSHLDAGPVHLVTTAALAWLQTLLPDSMLDERRFRPNLLVAIPGVTQVEHQWCGRLLAIGDTVRIRVSMPTERCGMVTFQQANLPKDPQIVRCITHEADIQFGVYANVIIPGRIMLGDRVQVVA